MNLDSILSLKIKLIKDCDIEIDYDSYQSFNRGKYGGTAWSAKLTDNTTVISEISLTECLLGKNKLVKNEIDKIINISVDDIYRKKTGFHVELLNSEDGMVAKYIVGKNFKNDVEYRLLKKNGICWVCHRNINAKSEPVVTFDSHRTSTGTVILCKKCIERMYALFNEN